MLENTLSFVYDSEINVKCAGINLIFDLLPYLSIEEKKTRITKIFIELIQSTNENVYKTMSGLIGKIY
jgi:hypothetical protein